MLFHKVQLLLGYLQEELFGKAQYGAGTIQVQELEPWEGTDNLRGSGSTKAMNT